LPLKKKTNAVQIKGFGTDINVILNSDVTFPDIERDLIRKLEKSRHYLAGNDIVLDARQRNLSEEECQKLDMILNTVFDLKIAYVRSEPDETNEIARNVGWKTEEDIQKMKKAEEPEDDEVEDDDSIVEIVKSTIRSGQKEYYPGSVVIIGDINPGGEVEAGGDIIIFGKLRGIAHAGINGNTQATITAIGLNPLQLRIAGIIARSPDSNLESEGVPEVAKIRDGAIVIESLDKSRRGD